MSPRELLAPSTQRWARHRSHPADIPVKGKGVGGSLESPFHGSVQILLGRCWESRSDSCLRSGLWAPLCGLSVLLCESPFLLYETGPTFASV